MLAPQSFARGVSRFTPVTSPLGAAALGNTTVLSLDVWQEFGQHLSDKGNNKTPGQVSHSLTSQAQSFGKPQ